MYSLSDVAKGLRNPAAVEREVSRLITATDRRWYASRDSKFNPRGTPIYDLDWDNLLILDACRYDIFRRHNTLDRGELSARYTMGSTSPEYVKANFAGFDRTDTVIVTSNGHYINIHTDDPLDVHRIHYVRESTDGEIEQRYERESHVDNQSGQLVQMPGPVTEAGIDHLEDYPDKRLIVHYAQPHAPYLGPTAVEHFDDIPHALNIPQFPHRLSNLWRDKIDVSRDVLRQCYVETLEVVLESVERLLDELTGRTIITADHGEMLGERALPIPVRFYGHGPGFYTDGLTKVPNLVIEDGSRRSISSESPNGKVVNVQSSTVEDRLKQLGYKV